jgi:hypothetical protein
MRSSMWLGVALVAGCTNFVPIEKLPGEDVFQQSGTDQVDILFVVDNSNSMALEQDLLASGFASFATELENSNTDFHVGVITTDFDYEDATRGQLVGDPPIIDRTDPNYLQTFQDRALIGIDGSGKEKGLEAALYALSPLMTTGPNAGFLRDEANLLIIVISDEEDCSDNGALALETSEACYTMQDKLTPVSYFVSGFKGLKPAASDKVQFSAIVGPENATGICDENSLPGSRYIEVARLMGGLSASICESDWSAILYDLGLNAAGIFTTFELEDAAEVGTIEVKVDGVVVPESEFDGWTYDPVAATITFHGQAIPARGSEITVTYTIASGS